MRAFQKVLIAAALVVFIIVFLCRLPNLLNPQYFGLQHKNQKWYSDFTAACDSILVDHPLGTNDHIRIPVTDPSIPQIIKDLHPIKLVVTYDRVWMLLGSDSHAGFGLEWHPKWGEPNVWVLDTIAESMETDIYSTRRIVPLETGLKP